MSRDNVLLITDIWSDFLESQRLTDLCREKNITRLVLCNLNEVMYQNEVEALNKRIKKLPYKVSLLTHNASHDSEAYHKIGMEWCAHTGWVWENIVGLRSIAQGTVTDTHNRSYSENQKYNTRGLTFIGKLRWIPRILFWDAFLAENLTNDFVYSYYPLLKHSNVYQHQQESLSILGQTLRTSPSDWDHYAQSNIDFDLTSQVPEYDPDVPNVFYTGYPTNPELYQQTRYTLAPETTSGSYTQSPWATEKTYRAIQNHHPYLAVGDARLNSHLHYELGYENFLDEFDVSDSDLNTDLESGGNSTDLGKALRHAHDTFMGNFDQNFDRIRDKVYYNRQHWISSAEVYRSKLRIWDRSPTWDEQGNYIPNLCDHVTRHLGIYIN